MVKYYERIRIFKINSKFIENSWFFKKICRGCDRFLNIPPPFYPNGFIAAATVAAAMTAVEAAAGSGKKEEGTNPYI